MKKTKVKKLNYKNMAGAYFASETFDDAQKLWNAFLTLYGRGFIDWDTLDKFCEICHGYTDFKG